MTTGRRRPWLTRTLPPCLKRRSKNEPQLDGGFVSVAGLHLRTCRGGVGPLVICEQHRQRHVECTGTQPGGVSPALYGRDADQATFERRPVAAAQHCTGRDAR